MLALCKYHCSHGQPGGEDEMESEQDHGVAQRHSDIEKSRKKDRGKYLKLGGRRKDYLDGASIWLQISQHRFQVNLMNAVHFDKSTLGRAAFIFSIVSFFIENIGQSVLQGIYFLRLGRVSRLNLWF